MWSSGFRVFGVSGFGLQGLEQLVQGADEEMDFQALMDAEASALNAAEAEVQTARDANVDDVDDNDTVGTQSTTGEERATRPRYRLLDDEFAWCVTQFELHAPLGEAACIPNHVCQEVRAEGVGLNRLRSHITRDDARSASRRWRRIMGLPLG